MDRWIYVFYFETLISTLLYSSSGKTHLILFVEKKENISHSKNGKYDENQEIGGLSDV